MTEFSEITSVKPRDWLVGTAYSAGSALLHKLPESLDFVTRKPASESSVQLRWRHLNKTPGELKQQWVHHQGVEGAKKRPSKFTLAQIILVDRDELTKLWATQQNIHNRFDSEPAVTYRLGTTVMMGATPGEEILFGSESLSGQESPDAQDYQVAMGLGEGPFDGGIGMYAFANKVYRGLDKGVRPGPVMPIAELPAYIPLV